MSVNTSKAAHFLLPMGGIFTFHIATIHIAECVVCMPCVNSCNHNTYVLNIIIYKFLESIKIGKVFL